MALYATGKSSAIRFLDKLMLKLRNHMVRRVVPSTGHWWVVSASTAERRNWVAPAHEGIEVRDAKGK